MKKIDGITTHLLAWAVFGLFAYVMYVQLQILTAELKINTEAKGLLDITTGALLMMVGAVKDYFFGSSLGSKRKTELMEDKQPK